MAIPLKNGADLYNFEVLRMRFHNLGADPTSDFGVGQVYFNTSTSEGSGKRVRIYDGSAFRSLAYFDEIDNRLKLLEGEIDTDAIISNMKEVSAFLEGFAEDASLMDLLNSKLSTSGGTINGTTNAPLVINTSSTGENGIRFQIGGSNKSWVGYSSTRGTMLFSYANGMSYAIGIGNDNVPFFGTSSVRNTLLHSGNIGSYKAGDSDMLGGRTLAWVQGNGLKIRRVKTAASATPADANVDLEGGGMIYSYSNASYLTNGPTGMGHGHIWQVGSYGSDVLDGQFAWDNNHRSQEDTTGKLWWRSRDSVNGWTYAKWHQIAFTDSNVASAQALVHSNRTVGATVDANGNVSFNGAGVIQIDGNEVIGKHSSFYIGYQTAVKDGLATRIWGKGFQFSNEAGTHRMIINESGNVTIGATDLAGDRKLYVAGKSAFIGADSKEVQVTVGNTVNQVQLGVTDVGVAYMFTRGAYDMAFSTSGTRRMTITAGGNVLIGTTEDDGSGAKLQIEGPLRVYEATQRRLYTRLQSSSLQIGRISSKYTGGYYGGITVGEDGTTSAYVAGIYDSKADNIKQFFYGGTKVEDAAILIRGVSGNVGIGKVSPTEKLHVVGNLLVEGNIIATGEVSAGGAGEEGDTGTGTGGGDALIYSQEFTPTTTSITITHNLSATKGVIVQVWEKNGNYWDMVLVDVEEVDTNTVTLFFGRTETTVHKVVIMG